MGDGEEGDIALMTPNPQLMLGYWREPERTRQCFLESSRGVWYVTGDRGVRDEDGYIWYRGRLDDIINSAGYRIGPTEIENILLQHPNVAECAVVGKPDPERGEIVKAFVVLKPDTAATEDEIIDTAKAHLASYQKPKSIEFVAELPKAPTGKILKRELREPYWADQGRSV